MPEPRIVDGLVAGAIAGLAQAVTLSVLTALQGKGLSWFFILIGYIFRPYAATPDTHAGAVIRGFVTHMIITTVLGGLFGLLAGWLPGGLSVWLAGVVYGVIVWAVGRFLLLAVIDPTLHDKMNTGLFLLAHLVYGGMLGLWLQRS